ncbi:MAG: hypothetical protein KAQ65_00140 [Candidatus Thorarchaeota archaeon]|nr:hypothetical protein [Candidatus Thorarchaeota archaeon]MCK5238353.1 hypothetical protein [Candidatus Thorarchaeota archaeon]
MADDQKLKNKLFKGLTEHDILTWEEEKMRFQRRMGKKVTDLSFLRHLLMAASRPVITTKDGVSSSFITGQGPLYEKGDTLLERYRSKTRQTPSESSIGKRKPTTLNR